MNNNRLCIALAILCCCACATPRTPADPQFAPTVKLLNEAHDCHVKHANDAPSAQKECFPILTNKQLRARAKKIDTIASSLEVLAEAGSDFYNIWCEPSKEDQKRIMNSPGTVKPG